MTDIRKYAGTEDEASVRGRPGVHIDSLPEVSVAGSDGAVFEFYDYQPDVGKDGSRCWHAVTVTDGGLVQVLAASARIVNDQERSTRVNVLRTFSPHYWTHFTGPEPGREFEREAPPAP